MRRRDRRFAAAAGLSGRFQRDRGRRPEPRRHGAGRARCRRGARRRRPPDRAVRAARCRPGWTGKLWAQHQGVEARRRAVPHPPDYLLFTDADIVYAPDALTRLVARAQAGGYVLTSLMAKLRCESLAERMFIPAFIFFFQMLYPFAWANDPRRATAAAAGGCMLVRREALRAGGRHGGDPRRADRRLRAGESAQGARPDLDRLDRARAQHPRLSGAWRISAAWSRAPPMRSLRYSPLLLAGTVLGLALTYLAPGALALFAGGAAQFLGIAAWLLMALAFQPTLRFYRRVACCGGWRCRRSPRSIWRSRSIPPISMRAGAAACGRAAPRQRQGDNVSELR